MADLQRGVDELCLEWLSSKQLGCEYEHDGLWRIGVELGEMRAYHLDYMVHKDCDHLHGVGLAKPDDGEWMDNCVVLRDWILERGVLGL